MIGNIIGEPFDKFVRDQINARQRNQHGGYNSSRTLQQLKYLNNRNAWIKLASSVNILPDINAPLTPEEYTAERYGLEVAPRLIELGESKLRNIGIEDSSKYLGTQLAEKAILFNSISEYIPASGSLTSTRAGVTNTSDLWGDNFAYGIGGANYGIQPPPGIIGVQVDSLNRGSIRKANITLKAHNKFQFDIIELLYLRLGFTMILEWGWDKYIDNNTGALEDTGNTIIEEEWFKTNGTSQLEMLAKINGIRRRYSGNYDGFFGKVSNFTWSFNPDGSYDISIDLITIGDVIESIKANTSVKSKFHPDTPFSEIKIKEGEPLFNTNIAKAATLNTIGYFLYKKIEKITDARDINYIKFETKDTASIKSPQYYIRLGEFLSQLENLIIPRIQNNGTTSVPQIKFEKIGCSISYFPNQISLDPRVCLFKPPLDAYGDITGITIPSYFEKQIPISYVATSNNITYGILTNLYINFEFISGLLIKNGTSNQELSLFTFLQDLCNGINDALGGVNKLEPIIKDDYIITIIDQTFNPYKEDNTILEVYGYNPDNQTSNFVKDIKFTSKITPQLASMISIGATAAGGSTSEIDGTAFSKFSEGLEDRFSRETFEPNGLSLLEIEQTKQKEEDYKKRFLSFDRAYSDNIIEAIGEAIVEAGTSFLSTLAEGIYTFKSFFNDGNQTIDDLNNLATERERDNDINEERIVIETRPGFESINGLPMFFKDYKRIMPILEKDAKNDTKFDENELNQLTSENYAAYLTQAFGGKQNGIQVVSTKITPNTVITGYGSAMSFESKTLDALGISENKARYLEFDDVFISQGKSAYKVYINKLNNNIYKSSQTPSSEIGFIPLSFDLILDGISGIKIYSKLNINNSFLPSNYPKSFNFIITKVNHRISDNSWETSLSTISMPRTEPYKFTSRPTPPNNGNTRKNENGASIPVSITQQPEFKGQLLPLKNIIGIYESNNQYDIANIGGNAIRSNTKVLNLSFAELKKFQSLPEGDPNRVFAAGKYQIIPQTLYGSKNWKQDVNGGLYKKLGLNQNDRFSPEIQEKIGDGLLLSRTALRNYLSGENIGTEIDLESAIQNIGQEFASMPIIYSSAQQKVGDVRTGEGQIAYYGGEGANPFLSKLGVKEMARILIQTRINYSNKPPIFIPIYYNS